MSILAQPIVASAAARAFQRLTSLAQKSAERGGRSAARLAPYDRFPQCQAIKHELTIPTSVVAARAVVYSPTTRDGSKPLAVHVNFHGGGYVTGLTELDDPLCRYLVSEADVVVVNVDYALAPQHRFPEPTRQVYEVVKWIAEHCDDFGWDATRLSVGGQSAGGGLAAAVARQALVQAGPAIRLQVLHYPPLDLATNARDKKAATAKPMLRPWMADVFDSAYVPDKKQRADPLVSPAHPSDTADLTGIAPALVITAELDLLRAEGERYAERLDAVKALAEYHVVAGADHGYDGTDDSKALDSYALIARHLRAAEPADGSPRTEG
jgi:acetyl esterase/lipase